MLQSTISAWSRDHRNSRQRENSEQNRSNYTEAECGKCSQEVKEDDWALFCESERKWYHIECDEVSEEEYQAYQVLGVQKLYFCKKCIVPVKRMAPVICGLEEFQQNVAARLEEVEQKNKELVEKIGELEEKIGDEIEARVEEKWKEWTEEQGDRKKRERNLMLHKVKEPSSALSNEEKKLKM